MRGVELTGPADPPPEFRRRWVVLWDGECGFCRRSVEWVLGRDRAGLLAAAPYQNCRGWLPEAILERSEEQVHLRSPGGRYWGGGAAAIRLVGLLGHPLLERALGLPPLRTAVGLGYRWLARHRSRLGRWIAGRPR